MPRIVELRSPTTYRPPSRYNPHTGASMSTAAVANYPHHSSFRGYSESPSREHPFRESSSSRHRERESYTPRSFARMASTTPRYAPENTAYTPRSSLSTSRRRETHREERNFSSPDLDGLTPTKIVKKYVYEIPCSRPNESSSRHPPPRYPPAPRASPPRVPPVSYEGAIVANGMGYFTEGARPYGAVDGGRYESRAEKRERERSLNAAAWRPERVTVDWAWR
ncbi:hypothetical protein BJ508DRAFT_301854 [Ascobolus immersus RN42]|uniref:Uncharacterized protein n=1 Tax=Ascobolus immersus RN42 TaxID=1160509 RepID=A0A3N4IK26_ASCIM|nr:hypothetical protein BJ508DRAFT_301854 [Ascobolus immersus RN42]